jgi:hypothetical protein
MAALARPKSDCFDPKIFNRAAGDNVGTIRRWIWIQNRQIATFGTRLSATKGATTKV